MKKIGILLLSLCALPMMVAAGTVENEIAERIKKSGGICLQGEDCASNSGAMVMASADSGGAKTNYDKTCATCHAAGIAGAPKLGDKDAWSPRIAKGMDVLYQSGINGLPPAMPAKGMCFTCSDDDIIAVSYTHLTLPTNREV